MTSTQTTHELEIALPDAQLSGTLVTPSPAAGLVVFAHGSGSSRHSPRNIAVANTLHSMGCATLLMDMLTMRESNDRRNVFDIHLLGTRVVNTVRWLAQAELAEHMPVGLFGASTGAAAALVAAAELGQTIRAVVSRGGRPDLAGGALPRVTAPTLLLVGSLDEPVIDLNEQAQRMLRCKNELVIIPGATHLFEEPGTLQEVARLAGAWFIEQFHSEQ
jgi:putative phosphoribosyl transferase